MDDVLKYGWCHHSGVEGAVYALRDKEMCISMTCGGSEISYTPTGYNQHYITHFLDPFVQTARTLKMKVKQPFIIYEMMKISDDDLEKSSLRYLEYLTK